MCLQLSYLTHFSGQGRNPYNNFVAFLENLRHHTFVLRLSDLYKTPKIGLRLTKASKLSRSLTFLLFPDQPFLAAARNSGTSRIFFSEICAYKNCDSHSQNTLALCFLGSKKKFPSAGGTRSFSESPRELSIDFL